MIKPKFEQAWAYALQRLETELPSHLYYHGVFHTRDDVVPAANRLAEFEGIKGIELSLLLTAAWFHDVGYVKQPLYHELISARIATEVLPEFGFKYEQVETVRWAILATALPQKPQNLFEQILTDADLDVLGREDYPVTSNNLRKELAVLGVKYDDLDWYTRQLAFIQEHTYFTDAAHALRDEGQRRNIEYAKKKVGEFT
jgi:uncharacterized protein